MTGLLQARGSSEITVLVPAQALLGKFVQQDDWPLDVFAIPSADRYIHSIAIPWHDFPW